MPVVSIVVPSFNRPKALPTALRSFLAQSLQDFEVLVVDDGSSPEAIEAYRGLFRGLDERFRLLVSEGPAGGGPAAARNRGIRAARGEFVSFCDDDDWYLKPDHLEIGTRALRQTDSDLYFTNAYGVSGDEVTIEDWFGGCPILDRAPRVHELSLETIAFCFGRYNIPCIDSWIVRRALFDRVGIFSERIRYSEDFHLLLRLVDGARGVLYRGEAAVAANVAPRVSLSSTLPAFERHVQSILAARDAAAAVRNPRLARAARRTEAWNLGILAELHLAEGRRARAVSTAWRSLLTRPSAGRLLLCARVIAEALLHRVPAPQHAPKPAPARPIRPAAPITAANGASAPERANVAPR